MKLPHTREETILWKSGYRYIAGCDEVGKGAWAGPLVAAAVILPVGFQARGIRDSKLLSPVQREKHFVRITKHAVSWAVRVIHHDVIDRIGIAKANKQALEQAVKKLHIQPDAVLVDAYPIVVGRKPVKPIIKGDTKVLCIAAASIVAKVVRDSMMRVLDREYPGYNFARHKGYGTEYHHQQINKLGPSLIHRMSFAPLKLSAVPT